MTRFASVRREWPLAVSLATTGLFLRYGKSWLGDLATGGKFEVIFAWLFAAILVSAFAVVRHAEALATRVGEPYGTLVLTLCMSGMEMMMIAAVMFTGKGARRRQRLRVFDGKSRAILAFTSFATAGSSLVTARRFSSVIASIRP